MHVGLFVDLSVVVVVGLWSGQQPRDKWRQLGSTQFAVVYNSAVAGQFLCC